MESLSLHFHWNYLFLSLVDSYKKNTKHCECIITFLILIWKVTFVFVFCPPRNQPHTAKTEWTFFKSPSDISFLIPAIFYKFVKIWQWNEMIYILLNPNPTNALSYDYSWKKQRKTRSHFFDIKRKRKQDSVCLKRRKSNLKKWIIKL